ncbi:diphthamide synthesis protein [Candidatus Woesearchaeota archaeon]|nr:diphthamide synthesis protein [Candidatus Woesearchaeota archaeon]
MKTFFLHAKSNVDIKPVLSKLKFKSKLGIITSVQFLEQVNELKNENFIIGGQVLGCNVNNALRIKDKVDAFLFIGSGDFHPLGALYKIGKPVYVANPYTNKIDLLDNKQFEDYEKKKKAMISKFLMSKKVGILISVKPGQFHPREYFNLKEKIEYAEKLRKKMTDKESYIFVGDNFDLNELENFRDIEIWVNTACPRIEGKSLLNTEDVFKLYEK